MTAHEPVAVEEAALKKYEQALMDAVVDIRAKGWTTIEAPDGLRITLDYRTSSDR